MSGVIRFFLATVSASRPPDGRLRCAVLLCAALLCGRLAGASPNAPDSSRVDEALPSPRGALLRSALLPGWGQLYNRRPVKAAFFGVSAIGLLGWAGAAQQELNERTDELEDLRRRDSGNHRLPLLIAARQDQAARRNTRILLLALCSTLAALDAYVDAQLADFAVTQTTVALHPYPGGVNVCFYAFW